MAEVCTDQEFLMVSGVTLKYHMHREMHGSIIELQ